MKKFRLFLFSQGILLFFSALFFPGFARPADFDGLSGANLCFRLEQMVVITNPGERSRRSKVKFRSCLGRNRHTIKRWRRFRRCRQYTGMPVADGRRSAPALCLPGETGVPFHLFAYL